MPTSPAARPPKAWDKAVRCGTAVSGTSDSGMPTMNPAMIARMIHPWCTTTGWTQVATTASSMAATPEYTPRRAVLGSFIQCNAKTNSAAATR